MCTATYLPKGRNGFILTHSRDEKSIRPAARPPQRIRIGGRDVVFPQDPQGMGSWIAMSANLTVCLLNGAFVPHQPKPPYRHSRGLVVVDVFDFVSVEAFIGQYRFDGLEPFTLLIAEAGRLIELRWNGKRIFMNEKDPQKPHIWSSVTLYSANIIAQRESWFADWQRQNEHWSVDAIRHFHKVGGDGNPNNAILMNRQNQYHTVSLTSIVSDSQQNSLYYEDLIQQTPIQQTTLHTYATI